MSVHHFFSHALAEFFHFDSKIFWVITMFLIVFGLSKPVLLFLQHRGIVFAETTLDHSLYLAGQAITFIYLFLAVRTFYRDNVFFAVVKAVALVFAMDFIMQLYRFILFLTALYTS